MDRHILRIKLISVLFSSWLLINDAVAANAPNVLVEDAASIANAVKSMDLGCWQLKTHGPCFIGEIPGVMISYYEPSLVIRTNAKKSSLNALSGGNLQFHEARIYDFPLKKVEQKFLCTPASDVVNGLRYSSTLDKERWRKETVPMAFDFIGKWGPLYPRTGFVNHYSKAVSSGLAALRAVSAAGIGSGHVTPLPILFFVNQLQDKIQMVEPYKQMCMMPGTDVRLWTRGDVVDKNGNYSWIYWRKMECCKTALPIPTST